MLKRSFVLLALLLCVLLGRTHSALAQGESLLIGSGDLVQVDVLETPEMEQQVRVTDRGTISLAYIGEVHIAGLTPAAAADEIRTMLLNKQVMKRPQVTLRVVEYATQNVSILGEVHAPGSYPLSTPQSILRVLALAGGVTDDADRHITVTSGTDQKTTYYLSNNADQAVDKSISVHPGDTILVPRAPRVYIMGDVNRPGGYAIATNDSRLTLLQAITAAGSETKTSVKSRVRLIRGTSEGGYKEQDVRLDLIEKGKQPDIALQANDVVYVPFSWMKNTAIGSANIVSSTASSAFYVIH